MTAHIVTATKELVDWTSLDTKRWNDIDYALSFAPWTDEMTMEDYVKFSAVVAKEDYCEFHMFVTYLHVKYNMELVSLGEPRTHEDWMKAKYQ
jgi:hypothetical protein